MADIDGIISENEGQVSKSTTINGELYSNNLDGLNFNRQSVNPEKLNNPKVPNIDDIKFSTKKHPNVKNGQAIHKPMDLESEKIKPHNFENYSTEAKRNNSDYIPIATDSESSDTVAAPVAANPLSKSKDILKDGTKRINPKTKEETQFIKPLDPEKLIKVTKEDHGFYEDIKLYDNMYWWGYFNMRSYLSNTIEYVFFTKPDLHLLTTNSDIVTHNYDGETEPTEGELIPALQNISYFQYIKDNYPKLLKELQYSGESGDNPFSNLLFNQLLNNIEIPSLEADAVESAVNRYGVGLSYRGSSEASNDNFDFSLEFKDTKWLDVYHYFRVYEEYETLKHHGVIAPEMKYIENRMIHDELSIYKFLVDEDASTIIYWCKYYGVMPKSLPRDVFSSASFDSGLSYSINFRASFFEDMNPDTLAEFNELYEKYTAVDYSKLVDNDLHGTSNDNGDHYDNYHTNINYSPVKKARVKYLARGEEVENKYAAYYKEDGSQIGRFVLEFYN